MVDSFVKFTVTSPPDMDFIDRLVKRVQDLTSSRVLVGVPSSTAGRLKNKDSGRSVGTLSEAPGAGERIGNNNAALAYIHNFGAPQVNIPPRPFLVPGVQNAIPKLMGTLKTAARMALEDDKGAVQKALHAIGLICQNEVRKKITEGPFVPLKQSTINARRSKHKGRKARTQADVRPLIDTGKLRQAQTYAIESGGREVFQNPVAGTGKYSKVAK